MGRKIKIIKGKNLKKGHILPGGDPDYDRKIDKIETIFEDYHKFYRKVSPSVKDTYRVAYFTNAERLPMTIFDNENIIIC